METNIKQLYKVAAQQRVDVSSAALKKAWKALQRRDAAYQVVLQAQRELKRFEHEYVAALKAVEQCST